MKYLLYTDSIGHAGATPEGVYRHMLTKTPEMLTVHPEGILTTCTVILLPRSCPVAGDVHRSHFLNAWILSSYQSEERTKPTVREWRWKQGRGRLTPPRAPLPQHRLGLCVSPQESPRGSRLLTPLLWKNSHDFPLGISLTFPMDKSVKDEIISKPPGVSLLLQH